ncbi:MAG: S41 family peptidase [Patescibacteria group bacterium]
MNNNFNAEATKQGNKKTKKKKGKVFYVFIFLIFIFIVSLSGFTVGKFSEGKITIKGNPTLYKETKLTELFDNSLVEQAWTILKSDFVDQGKLDEKEMFYGALKGFVSAAGDPYTVLFDPQTAKEFEDQIAGAFEGIGAEIGLKEGVVVVVAALPDSPASKAGLMSGDKIFSVDAKQVTGMSLDKVVRMIRGAKGTNVSLIIVRGDEEPREVVITRDVIELKSIKWQFRDDGILKIDLMAFNVDTTDLFMQIVKEAKTKNPRGIILDLRNNPGGLLDTALDIASAWVQTDLVLIEKFGDGREIAYNGSKNAFFKGLPTVVLINQGSASGSEIVAGALQDYGLAKIVGQKSFGKGSVQAVKKLSDGSSLKVTIAKWLTPKGRSINDEGIKPDIEVKFTKEDFDQKKDPQLDKAIEILLKKDK